MMSKSKENRPSPSVSANDFKYIINKGNDDKFWVAFQIKIKYINGLN